MMADLSLNLYTAIAVVGIVAIAIVVVIFPVALMFWGGHIIETAREWLRERMPTGRRRAEAGAAEAARLGLRFLGRDATSLDLTFPFLQTGRVSIGWVISAARRFLAVAAIAFWAIFAYLSVGMSRAEELEMTILVVGGSGILVAGLASLLLGTRKWTRDVLDRRERPLRFSEEALRPAGPSFITALVRGVRVEQIFAGRWSGLDVRVFDYSYSVEDSRVEWTCAVLPLQFASPGIEIVRESRTSRVKAAVGLKDLTLGQEAFDRAFRIVADDDNAARRLLDARVRSRLLKDATPRFVIQLQGRRMLYCCSQVPTARRGKLLDIAKGFRDSLPHS